MALPDADTITHPFKNGLFQNPEKPKGLVKWISYLIKIGGVVLLLNTLYTVVGNVYMLAVGQAIEGTITGSYREQVTRSPSSRTGSSDMRSVERPVISYEVNGESYQFHGVVIGAIGTNYEMGGKVALLVMPNNPDYSVINSFLEMWLTPMLLIILSGVIFGFGHVLHRIVFIVSRMMKRRL